MKYLTEGESNDNRGSDLIKDISSDMDDRRI